MWRWGARDGAEVPSEEVNALFDALDNSRATGFLDAAPPDAAGEPPLAVTLKEGTEESSPSLTVTVSAGSTQAGRRVSSTATTTAYIVPPVIIDTLIARAAAVKEPQAPAAPAAGAAATEGSPK